MKRDLAQPILHLDGTEFSDKPTLQSVCFMALTANLPREDLDGQQKLALYKLASRVSAGGVIDLAAEDLTTLKTRIGSMFSVEVVGRSYELLDADYVETSPAE